MAKAKKKDCRKAGRNGRSPAHQRYLMARRWNTHKVNRVARYIRKHPNWKLPDDMNDELRVRVQMLLK